MISREIFIFAKGMFEEPIYFSIYHFIQEYNRLQARFACLRCAACGHCVSAESPRECLELLNLTYLGIFLTLYKYYEQKLTKDFLYGSENIIFEI